MEWHLRDLRSFLSANAAAVCDVDEPLSTVHEITALQHVLEKQGRYPVILVRRPVYADGHEAVMPVVTNLTASRELTARALDIADHREAARVIAARTAAGIEPVAVERSQAPVQQQVFEGDACDLRVLPALTQHELEPGPYLTAAHATTFDPESGVDNTAIQRCWIKAPRRMSWFPYPASHNARNLERFWQRGEACPVAFWIGHDPAVELGTQAKLRYPQSHWDAAGGVIGEALRLVPTITHGAAIRVPADAEIVVEGFARPHDLGADGPFGEYTGYLGPQVTAPVVEVSCITMRAEPIYRDYGSGLADALVPDNLTMEGKLYAIVKAVAPALVNVHVPVSGRRFHAYLQLASPQRGETRDAITAALAYRRTKAVVAVDTDVDIFSSDEVLWAIATRVQWSRDSFVIDGLSGSMLDPSLPSGASTASKIGIDATLPPAVRAGTPRPVPPRISVPQAALDRAIVILGSRNGERWPGA